MKISFSALGEPRPQGSTRAFMVAGKPRITSTTKGLADWRRNIKLSATAAWNRDAVATPCEVEAHFLFARPQCHYGTGKNANVIKDAMLDAIPPTDIDKLLRALLDGMTSVIYRDDRQVSRVNAYKGYVRTGQHVGAHVTVIVEDEPCSGK